MARNASWDRWVYASIAKHLEAEITSPVVFDFGGKRTSAWETADHRVEISIGGFRTRQVGRSAFKVECSVFAIVTSNLTTNNFTHVDVVGDVANALDQCITVMDYGATGLVEVGLLHRARGGDAFVSPDHIKPKQTDDLLHSTISATLGGRFQT